MGLLISIIVFPSIHRTRTHRLVFYGLRVIALVGIIVLYVALVHNFYSADSFVSSPPLHTPTSHSEARSAKSV
jgi:hypothetical protein